MAVMNHVRRAAGAAITLLALASLLVSRVAAFAAQNDFKNISDLPQQESISASPLVLGAYALVWLFVVAFVFSMWRRMSAIEKELADARREFSARKSGR